MLKFINISTHDYQQYIVVDEDVMYKWNPTNETPVKHWLENRDMFSFKLYYVGDMANIAVYKDDKCLLYQEVREVDYL